MLVRCFQNLGFAAIFLRLVLVVCWLKAEKEYDLRGTPRSFLGSADNAGDFTHKINVDLLVLPCFTFNCPNDALRILKHKNETTTFLHEASQNKQFRKVLEVFFDARGIAMKPLANHLLKSCGETKSCDGSFSARFSQLALNGIIIKPNFQAAILYWLVVGPPL